MLILFRTPVEMSSFLPVQYSGRGRGMYEKQEELGPAHVPSYCLCPCPFTRRPGPPTGGSCRSQQESSTLRALTWGAASRRRGPTMRLGDLLRRYGWLIRIPGGRMQSLALDSSSHTEHFLVSLTFPSLWFMSLFSWLTSPFLYPFPSPLFFLHK